MQQYRLLEQYLFFYFTIMLFLQIGSWNAQIMPRYYTAEQGKNTEAEDWMIQALICFFRFSDLTFRETNF